MCELMTGCHTWCCGLCSASPLPCVLPLPPVCLCLCLWVCAGRGLPVSSAAYPPVLLHLIISSTQKATAVWKHQIFIPLGTLVVSSFVGIQLTFCLALPEVHLLPDFLFPCLAPLTIVSSCSMLWLWNLHTVCWHPWLSYLLCCMSFSPAAPAHSPNYHKKVCNKHFRTVEMFLCPSLLVGP